jgi:ABC-2 type transport system permease protein
MKGLQFKWDFALRILMDCVYYIVQFLFFKSLLSHFPLIEGWNASLIYIFISGYIFIDALMMTFCANNLWWIPEHINRGTLDYYLTKPISSLFFCLFRDFAADSMINLGITLSLLTYSVYPYGLVRGLSYVLLLVCSTVLMLGLHTLLITLNFWSPSVNGLKNMTWEMAKIAERPDSIYKGWARKIFTTVIPYCLVVSFPLRIVFIEQGEARYHLIFQFFLTLLLFWTGIILLWKKGTRIYSSASS